MQKIQIEFKKWLTIGKHKNCIKITRIFSCTLHKFAAFKLIVKQRKKVWSKLNEVKQQQNITSNFDSKWRFKIKKDQTIMVYIFFSYQSTTLHKNKLIFSKNRIKQNNSSLPRTKDFFEDTKFKMKWAYKLDCKTKSGNKQKQSWLKISRFSFVIYNKIINQETRTRILHSTLSL